MCKTSKDDESLSKEIKLLLIGAIFGAVASGIITYEISLKLSSDEKDAELQNIAQALYIDVSGVEDILNYSLNRSSFGSDYINASIITYYENNGLYYTFSKDISRFDNETAVDLYDFYSFIMSLESKQEELNAIAEKRAQKQNLTDYEAIKAEDNIRSINEGLPIGIKKANKVKQDLRQIHNVRMTLSPSIITTHSPRTYKLDEGRLRITT
jgi:hypothetical protein